MTPDTPPPFDIRPLGPHIGAEITGLDAKAIGHEVDAGLIRDLLFKHQLLCFRDQQLEAADVMAFTRLFGTPDPHVLQQYTLPGFRDILVISNIVENGKPLGSTEEGFGWHTDLTYLPLPAAYTILYALEIPPEGGETLYASMDKAYDSLPAEDRERLRPLNGIYSYAKLYGRRKNAVPLTDEQKARTPDVVHPMVRVHPHTGREGMYVNLDDCIGVEGMSPEDGFALIKKMFDLTVQNFAYTHRWKVRDLMIWDNRGALHAATPYDKERHRRLIYRTSVQGEKPLAPTL